MKFLFRKSNPQQRFNDKKRKFIKPNSKVSYDSEGYIVSIDERIFIRPKLKTITKPKIKIVELERIKKILYDPWIIGVLLIILQKALGF